MQVAALAVLAAWDPDKFFNSVLGWGITLFIIGVLVLVFGHMMKKPIMAIVVIVVAMGAMYFVNNSNDAGNKAKATLNAGQK
jgi:uncharacterized membrane protein